MLYAAAMCYFGAAILSGTAGPQIHQRVTCHPVLESMPPFATKQACYSFWSKGSKFPIIGPMTYANGIKYGSIENCIPLRDVYADFVVR